MSTDWPLILAYHHVEPSATGRFVISPAAFEAQLRRMRDSGFTPITLQEAVDSGRTGRCDAAPKTFTLTFDDAFASFKAHAFPVLERTGLLAASTVFVPTDFVGGDNAWRTRVASDAASTPDADVAEALMTWDDIEALRSSGVGIASHGHEHLDMGHLSYEAARTDVETSLAQLAAHGIETHFLALPYGWSSESSKRAIADAGCSAAFSVTRGGHDRFEIRRVPVYGTDGPLMSRLKLSGRFFDVFDAAATIVGRRRSR